MESTAAFSVKRLSQSAVSRERKSPAENHAGSVYEDLPLCLTPFDCEGNLR